jgi:hypothetical protein
MPRVTIFAAKRNFAPDGRKSSPIWQQLNEMS